ncbi:hypothetical protein BKA69DRAFT_750125 [Paraphysoderma sedebokerense]|nr:hypothetical protein BKA69DRAFT_750125 [Paraphysoderma sedebokerense]
MVNIIYTHSANRYHQQIFDQMRHERHVERILTTQPAVDQKLPVGFEKHRYDAKKNKAKQERAKTILRENELLLQKLHDIAQRKNIIKHYVPNRNIFSEMRLQELKKIDRDNQLLINRLKKISQVSAYSRARLLKERAETESHIQRISQFHPEISKRRAQCRNKTPREVAKERAEKETRVALRVGVNGEYESEEDWEEVEDTGHEVGQTNSGRDEAAKQEEKKDVVVTEATVEEKREKGPVDSTTPKVKQQQPKTLKSSIKSPASSSPSTPQKKHASVKVKSGLSPVHSPKSDTVSPTATPKSECKIHKLNVNATTNVRFNNTGRGGKVVGTGSKTGSAENGASRSITSAYETVTVNGDK